MEKKLYIKPEMETLEIAALSMLVLSGDLSDEIADEPAYAPIRGGGGDWDWDDK
ncbi:MAG: hypothetical protein IJ635_00840 [Bacteroidaceae bacterium]|nr:hypothetical protein [Bacteroidaceae bacterium]